MENTQKNKSRTFRVGKWKAMLVIALLCFNIGQTLGANRTITVNTTTNAGTVRYKIGDGAWSSYQTSLSFTVEDGQEVTIFTLRNIGWTFRRWTENGMQVSSSSTYTFTVSSNRTLTAVFDNTTWTGDLVDGSTYRVTSLSDYTFNVYRDGNPAGYYSELGPLYTRNGTVTIIFDNDYAIRAIGTIRVEGTATLNVDVQGGDRTIKRASNYDNMFDAGQNSTMIINAAKAHRFIIDGGAVYATANDGRTAYNRSSYRGRLFYVEGGFELYNAILQNDYSHTLPGLAPLILFTER